MQESKKAAIPSLTDKGTLTITDIENGIISYIYTLTASQDQNEGDVADKFANQKNNFFDT